MTQLIATIGMPVYNAMPYLPEAVESLLAQQCPDFEILAMVDGAENEDPDGSLDYLRSIRDPRLRILTQPHQGVTPTLNRLLAECRTPWLIRQDADDVSYPQRVARLLTAINKFPDAGMFYSFARYHPQGSLGTFRSSSGTSGDLRNIVRSGYLLAICHPTVALNVEKTRALGGYRIGLHNEDADLWWRMALRHDIHCIPEELVGFRQHSSSVSARNLAKQSAAALYVQYLLVSELNHRTPRTFSAIQAHLQRLFSKRNFRAKERLRASNIHFARREYLRGAAALTACAAASPAYLARRLCDEFVPRGPIRNGISPHLFFEYQEELWP